MKVIADIVRDNGS